VKSLDEMYKEVSGIEKLFERQYLDLE
jgi:hypothetical protein